MILEDIQEVITLKPTLIWATVLVIGANCVFNCAVVRAVKLQEDIHIGWVERPFPDRG